MTNFAVNLDNCDLEPIHIPGQIQSHGFLVVLDDQLVVKYLSENIHDFLKVIPADLLDKPLFDFEVILNNKIQQDFITQLIKFGIANGFDQTNPYEIKITGFPFYLVISKSGEYYLLEFEQVASATTFDIQNQIGRSIAGMLGDKNLKNLLDNAAVQIKNIIQYDRVMIYRFAEDGHGEVVAEALNDPLTPWLGLHYPASDIPKQARDLYKLNLTRLIANVHDTPSKIITQGSNNHQLDLTNSQLRAVSPIHIQYLKNMGVASSFSISLIYKGELWGLIACHNYSPRFIDFKSRESAKLIGQILSSALEFRQDEETQSTSDGMAQALDKLTKYLNQQESIEDALIQQPVNLLNIGSATGAVLIHENKIASVGITPAAADLEGLVNWIKENVESSIFSTNHLLEVYPKAANFKSIASGIIVCVLSKELREYIIWFKPEIIQTINWAGNPDKPFELGKNGLSDISPRNSFELWVQTVEGKSDQWSKAEISLAKQLRDEIIYVINQKANALRILNEKLRLAYEELDTFSYTISHDLKNPLSIIKTYAELLTRDQTIGDRGINFLNRIGKGADKMNSMITEVLQYSKMGRTELQYSSLDVRSMIMDIIADLKVIYNTAELDITIGNTPDIAGDMTMIFQVFSNLIGNAVKYSQHANRAEVTIDGEIDGDEVCYRITDNGIGIDQQDHSKLFNLFHRLENAKDFDGTGVGLSIVKRIVDKHHGRIWVSSEIGKGSTFHLSFKSTVLTDEIQCA